MAPRRAKGTGSVFKDKKSGIYQFQIRINGQTVKQSLGTKNRQDANKKADDLYTDLHSKNKIEVVTKIAQIKKMAVKDRVKLNQAWELFEKSPLRNQSTLDGTMEIYRNTLDKFLVWKNEAYPNIDSLSDISVNIASEFAQFLDQSGFSGDTYNRHIKNMLTITNVLMKKAELDDNVWTHIKRKENRSVGKKKLSREELARLLKIFDDIKLMHKEQMKIMFYIGVFTGMRLIDCALIKWEYVDFEKGLISLIPHKTRQSKIRIKVPIHTQLYEMLVIAGEQWGYDGFVIPDVAERYRYNASGVKKDAIKVFKLAGFETTIETPEGIQRILRANQYGFHSLRHTFISECASNGILISTLSEMTGDKIKTLEKYYIEINEEVIINSVKYISELPPVDKSEIKSSDITLLECKTVE